MRTKKVSSKKSTKSKSSKSSKSKTTTKAGSVIVKPRGSKDSALSITPSANSFDAFFNIITNDKSAISYSPAELVRLNTGYVSVCNNKNSATIANVPVKLYYNMPSSSIKSTQHKKVSYLEFKNLKSTLSSPIAKQLQTESDIVEIVEHPVLDLLSVINNSMNYVDFVSFIQIYLGLIGNAYVKINFDSTTGLPSSLDPLLAEYVTPIADNAKHGKISGYKYTAGKKTRTYAAKEIIHFLNYSAGSRLIGVGELEQCINAVTRYNTYDAFETAINKNYGRPDYLISYRNKINKKDLDEIYKQITKRLGGSNKGSAIVTSGEIDVKNLGFAPKEMSWLQGRKSCIQEICNSFGLPESFVALNSSNLASALTASNEYARYLVFPKAAKMLAKLNEKLLPFYKTDGLFLWYDSLIRPDAVTNSQMIVEQFNSGLIDRNEARQELGYDPSPLQAAQSGEGTAQEDE